MKLEARIQSELDLPDLVCEIRNKLPQVQIFLLDGPLGAGKTAFVKAYLSEFFGLESKGSPTFPVLHEYHSGGKSAYHLDLYRIENEQELFDRGIESQIWERPCLTFVEWPDRAPGFSSALKLNPPLGSCAEVHVDILTDGSRKFSVIPVQS